MTTMTREAEYALRAEARAVEAGRLARLNDDGSISVKSDSIDGVTYRVTFEPMDLVIRFNCTCKAGQHRHETVPCKHAAAAARRLEREGLARWVDGYWLLTEKSFAIGRLQREAGALGAGRTPNPIAEGSIPSPAADPFGDA